MKIKEKIKNLKLKTAQVYIALISEETPWYAKIVAALAIGYALSPIDFIPDFIPVLGYLDDIIILPILITLCIKLIPKQIWESYEEKAKAIWKEGQPIKWYYAIPIVLIWLAIVTLIIFAILIN